MGMVMAAAVVVVVGGEAASAIGYARLLTRKEWKKRRHHGRGRRRRCGAHEIRVLLHGRVLCAPKLCAFCFEKESSVVMWQCLTIMQY